MRIRSWLVWGVVLNISYLGSAGLADARLSGEPDPRPAITVRVYDYEGVPASVLKKAEEQAARIFRQVGLEVIWTGCPTSDEELRNHPTCNQLPDPLHLMLQIVPRSKVKGRFTDPSRVGVARIPHGVKGFGTIAAVYDFRAEEQAARRVASRSAILGHIMAHEIGHLLLSVEQHADRGLMCGGWSREDLISMSQGTLLFHPEEAQRIQAQMLERIHASATIPGEVNPRPTITVRVFNYAGVAERIVAVAQEQAGRVLRDVDVHTLWVDCPTSLAALQTNTRCRGRAAPTELVIRIVPRSQNPRCQLGFAALPKEKGNLATHASVFYEAAEDLAAGYSASNSQMLGYILAHEIGHLLLGEGSHAGKGIMRTPWRKPEMERAAEGRLGFSAKQANRIRADVLARVAKRRPATANRLEDGGSFQRQSGDTVAERR